MCSCSRPDRPTPNSAAPSTAATTSALSAARELPHVSLEDALELVLLIREKEPERYGRAAARWAARWSSELPGVDLGEAQLVQAALANLASEGGRAGAGTLLALTRQRGLKRVEAVLRRWLERTTSGWDTDPHGYRRL
jgi:hypothetical protein